MRTLTAIATTFTLASLVLPATASAQLRQADPGRPAKPAPSEGPREPARGPEKPVPTDGAIRIEIEGIDGVLLAVAVDQDFSIGESSGRRLPQATVTLTREPDEFTAALLKGHTRGTRFRDATITSQAGGTNARFTMKLTDIVIESVRLHAGEDGTEEVVTLRFGKVWWSDADGHVFEWNYATMSAR